MDTVHSEAAASLPANGDEQRQAKFVHFSYEVLPLTEEARDGLKVSAESIRANFKQTLEGVIAIGNELSAAKHVLGHGHFLKWISAEFSMSHGSAENYMRAAAWCAGKFATVANLPLKTIYLLAAPGTPASAQHAVISRAQQGEIVTEAAARELVRKAKATTSSRERDSGSTPRKMSPRQHKREKARSGTEAKHSETTFAQMIGDRTCDIHPQLLELLTTIDPVALCHAMRVELERRIAATGASANEQGAGTTADDADSLAIPGFLRRTVQSTGPDSGKAHAEPKVAETK